MTRNAVGLYTGHLTTKNAFDQTVEPVHIMDDTLR